MSYIVKVDNVLCPDDIGQPIRLECVLYDGEKEIIRENVVYTGNIIDNDIEVASKEWASPYVNRGEQKKDIEKLTIVGKPIILDEGGDNPVLPGK